MSQVIFSYCENDTPKTLIYNGSLYQANFAINVKYPPKQFTIKYFDSTYSSPILYCKENGNIFYHRECKTEQFCWCNLIDSLIWCGEGECKIKLDGYYNLIINAKMNSNQKVIAMNISASYEYQRPIEPNNYYGYIC